MYVYENAPFLDRCMPCLQPAEGRFSRSRLQGTQGVRVYTTAQFGPQPGSVRRALGVQSRASWQAMTGSLSASPSLRGQWKPHNFIILLCCCCVIILSQTSSENVLFCWALQHNKDKLGLSKGGRCEM